MFYRYGKPIRKAEEAKILSDLVIQTDRKIKSNRPEGLKRKTCLLIDMSLRRDNNVLVIAYNQIIK